MNAALELAPQIGVAAACRSVSVSRATLYRHRQPRPTTPRVERAPSPRALADDERQQVLDVLHQEEFVDLAPAEVHARLLDEGRHLCSIRTMYRLLDASDEVRERRDQLRHPPRVKPQLVATAPNQVWTWDITKLLGPAKWTYYYLYVILDLYSRFAVGWMLAHRECASLAERLIRETLVKQSIVAGALTLHSDRGAPMRSQTVAQLLAGLGVVKSHSRPHVSNDNAFSESQFKTLKYQPEFPDRFASFDAALSHCREFFPWYNGEHRHWGLALLTPEMVHLGRADEILAARQRTMDAAFAAHPERFVRGRPCPLALPREVWINRPSAHSLNRDEEPVLPPVVPSVARVATLNSSPQVSQTC